VTSVGTGKSEIEIVVCESSVNTLDFRVK